jgi:hypothetical protein
MQGAKTAVRSRPSLRDWIVQHDESWIFVAAYIGLAVILSTMISLFWLVAVVGVHFAFEWIRQRRLNPGAVTVLPEVMWELKLDFALILFAFVVTLYMDVVLGVAGLGAATRLASATRIGTIARAGVRFQGLERALRGIVLSADDVAQAVTRALGRKSRGPADSAAPAVAPATAASGSVWGSWTLPWTRGDWLTVLFGLACIPLLLATPWLTEHTSASALASLVQELHPFPGRN